ncbi:MAG: gliding motility lipoprotein GldD [Bacteroidota bacterium]
MMVAIILSTTGCNNSYTPKPKGYVRIDLPAKEYKKFNPDNCPFSFEHPEYTKVEPDERSASEPCWYNITSKEYQASIHMSYKPVSGNLPKLLEDTRAFVYKHAMKADDIEEKLIRFEEKKVHGIVYDIKGNAASSVQFFVTDSTRHFMRGALYFYTQPNYDSLAPVIHFFREDIIHLMKTFEWKK